MTKLLIILSMALFSSANSESLYEYEGCWKDNVPNTMELIEVSDLMTPESCALSCLAASDDYTHFGVQSGEQCNCGAFGTCSPTFLAIHQDWRGPGTSGGIESFSTDDPDYGVDNCCKRCRETDGCVSWTLWYFNGALPYLFCTLFATENDGTGPGLYNARSANVITPQYSAFGAATCDMACAGDSNQVCGAQSANSVYRLNRETCASSNRIVGKIHQNLRIPLSETQVVDSSACCAACQNNKACVSWTFEETDASTDRSPCRFYNVSLSAEEHLPDCEACVSGGEIGVTSSTGPIDSLVTTPDAEATAKALSLSVKLLSEQMQRQYNMLLSRLDAMDVKLDELEASATSNA